MFGILGCTAVRLDLDSGYKMSVECKTIYALEPSEHQDKP